MRENTLHINFVHGTFSKIFSYETRSLTEKARDADNFGIFGPLAPTSLVDNPVGSARFSSLVSVNIFNWKR